MNLSRLTKLLTLIFLVIAPTFSQDTTSEPNEPWTFNPGYEVPLLYRQELEKNLLWMIDREGQRIESGSKVKPIVGVYADAGVWHLGAKSIVFALERDGIACRVLDHAALGRTDLSPLKAIIVPGGYSFYMREGVGERGVAEIRQFVERGGTYLGVCAGSYFASKNVLWEKKNYPYPLRLFDGTTEGSLSNIATWPNSAGVKMMVANDRPEFQLLGQQPIYYKGGGRFIGGTNVDVIATYPDGTAAVIERKVGAGRVVLSGGHFERPIPATDANGEKPPPEFSGKVYGKLLGLAARTRLDRNVKWNAAEFRSTLKNQSMVEVRLAREEKLRGKLKRHRVR